MSIASIALRRTGYSPKRVQFNHEFLSASKMYSFWRVKFGSTQVLASRVDCALGFLSVLVVPQPQQQTCVCGRNLSSRLLRVWPQSVQLCACRVCPNRHLYLMVICLPLVILRASFEGPMALPCL